MCSDCWPSTADCSRGTSSFRRGSTPTRTWRRPGSSSTRRSCLASLPRSHRGTRGWRPSCPRPSAPSRSALPLPSKHPHGSCTRNVTEGNSFSGVGFGSTQENEPWWSRMSSPPEDRPPRSTTWSGPPEPSRWGSGRSWIAPLGLFGFRFARWLVSSSPFTTPSGVRSAHVACRCSPRALVTYAAARSRQLCTRAMKHRRSSPNSRTSQKSPIGKPKLHVHIIPRSRSDQPEGGTMPLPTLTEEQRREALAKAAEARKKRAELKDQLKTGKLSLRQILDRRDDETVGKMKMSSVLESLPGVGKVRAKKIMERLDISTSRRVRGLGAKQRDSLLGEFAKK